MSLTMSAPFLQRVAEKFLQRNRSQEQRKGTEYVILPTQRACLYFKYYLSKISQKTILAPVILTEEAFFSSISHLEKPDDLTLIFELYHTYKKFDLNKSHDLENFVPIGMAMLRDFSMIDKHLPPQKAQKLLEYLRDVKRIEKWAEDLHLEKNLTRYKYLNEYFKFWEYFYETYFEFKKSLLQSNKAYLGLIFRHVAENISQIIKEEEIEFVTVAGFHQFSQSEQQTWAFLHQQNKVDFYFDTDRYYLDNKHQEAGYSLRKTFEWLQEIGYAIDTSFHRDMIRSSPKEIVVIPANYSVLQSKIVGNLLLETQNQWKNPTFQQTPNQIAIVLPEYNLLHTLLHSLPASFIEAQAQLLQEQQRHLINITMGFQMRYSQTYEWIKLFFALQKKYQISKGYYHEDVVSVLLHPFVRHIENPEALNKILLHIRNDGLVFVPEEVFHQAPFVLLLHVFVWCGNDTNSILQHIKECIFIIYQHLDAPEYDAERSFLLKLYTFLHRFEEFYRKSSHKESLTVSVLEYFLSEMLRNVSLPFTGEPISPIQVLGLLETRTLDFEEVIILSCNEGVLPQGKIADSLIPFDLRRMFHLPTYQENDTTCAYLFYRLFEQARKIMLLYVDAKDSVNSQLKEPSRFLLQIRKELASLPNITFRYVQPAVVLPENLSLPGIRKTPQIVQLVKQRLSEGIAPSALITFLRNPREFFTSYIMKIDELNEIEENIDSRTFGTLLHGALEFIFQNFIQNKINVQNLNELIEKPQHIDQIVKTVFKKYYNNLPSQTGKNYLAQQVAQKLVLKFLEQQKKEIDSGNSIVILSLEKVLYHEISLKTNHNDSIVLKLKGIADRIDHYNGNIRIVDYKTGTYNKKSLEATSREELLKDDEKGKIIQLMLYRYLVYKNNKAQNEQLPFSGFYFFRKLGDGFITYQLQDEPQQPILFCQYVEEFLAKLVNLILDTSIDFIEKEK